MASSSSAISVAGDVSPEVLEFYERIQDIKNRQQDITNQIQDVKKRHAWIAAATNEIDEDWLVQDTKKRLDSIDAASKEINLDAANLFHKMTALLLTILPKREDLLFPNQKVLEEEFLGLIKFFAEPPINPTSDYETLKQCVLTIAALLEKLEFRDTTYSAAFLEYVLKWLEDRQADSEISGLRIINILSKLLVCDKDKNQETRMLKLFWTHAHGVPKTELVLWLSKVARHYSYFPEVGCQEEFVQTNEERASFLHACSSADIATCFSNGIDGAIHHAEGQKAIECWAQKENNLHTNAFSKLANALSIDFPITTRLQRAKECLDRLDLAKHMSADLNPYESDTLASVVNTVMSPELQALNALKKEMELDREAVLQVEELSERHLQAYEALKNEQYERLDKFFRDCQEENGDVVKEALYKKAKYLASVEKASIRCDVKLSSEDLLKRIVQKAGGALKEAEGKLQAKSLEKLLNSECALCYSKFSRKRKRACLAPCGHTSACFDCAIKAWKKKPNCPWCKAAIQKPIPVPAKLFF